MAAAGKVVCRIRGGGTTVTARVEVTLGGSESVIKEQKIESRGVTKRIWCGLRQ